MTVQPSIDPSTASPVVISADGTLITLDELVSNHEVVKPDFCATDAILQPDYRIIRVDVAGMRCYTIKTLDGELPESWDWLAPSVTEITSATIAPKPLNDWQQREGMYANKIRDAHAEYGTMYHIFCSNVLMLWLMHKTMKPTQFADAFGISSGDEDAFQAAVTNGVISYFLERWQELSELARERKPWEKFKSDAAAFIRWVQDYDVRLVASELPLFMWHGETAIAGGVTDAIVDMLAKPNENKRHNVLVDFKSGSIHQTGIDHQTGKAKDRLRSSIAAQLMLYRRMFNANHPEFEIHDCGVFAPKDWRKNPAFHWEKLSEAKNAIGKPYSEDFVTSLLINFREHRGTPKAHFEKVLANETAFNIFESQAQTKKENVDVSLREYIQRQQASRTHSP